MYRWEPSTKGSCSAGPACSGKTGFLEDGWGRASRLTVLACLPATWGRLVYVSVDLFLGSALWGRSPWQDFLGVWFCVVLRRGVAACCCVVLLRVVALSCCVLLCGVAACCCVVLLRGVALCCFVLRCVVTSVTSCCCVLLRVVGSCCCVVVLLLCVVVWCCKLLGMPKLQTLRDRHAKSPNFKR